MATGKNIGRLHGRYVFAILMFGFVYSLPPANNSTFLTPFLAIANRFTGGDKQIIRNYVAAAQTF